MIAIPIAVPVSAKKLFAGLKRYADLIKDLATGGTKLREKIAVSKARTDLLHSSRASVERLVRVLKDRFEATNKAIDEAQKPLPAYIKEQDEVTMWWPARELSPIFGDGLIDQAATVAG